MSVVNRIILLGTIENEAKLQYCANGTPQIVLLIGTTSPGMDAARLSVRHKVKIKGEQAKICASHLKLGSRVMIEGALSVQKLKKGGSKKVAVMIIANRVQFLGGQT